MSEKRAPSIAGIADLVRQGAVIDERWSEGLHLHVDQPQPVLHVHRGSPEDGVVGSLLAGQACVLMTTEGPRGTDSGAQAATAAKIASTVLEALVERFGCALLVEIWAAPENAASEDEDLRLVAPREGAPDRAMETLERALARSELNHRPWRVVLQATEEVAPPGCEALVARDATPGLRVLGLAVSPRWRRAGGGSVGGGSAGGGGGDGHPKVLRDMRRGLGRALKEMAFNFSRRHARIGAPHYHVLGRKSVTAHALACDRSLCAVAESYSLLLDVTPVNVPAARAAFGTARTTRAPEFHYRPLVIDPAAMKRRLYEIDIEPVEDPALHDLLSAKREEIDREITLLDNRCGPRFLPDSMALFGGVEPGLRDLARRILQTLPRDGRDGSGFLDAEALAARAEAEIDRLRQCDPSLRSRVQRRKDVSGLVVSHGDLLVGPDGGATEGRAAALVQHEVGTHILTHHNGGRQPLRQLKSGMAGYEETQEGIAVLAEYLVGGLTSSRLRLLAARVLAVEALIDRADFIEVVQLLSRRYGFAHSVAFTVAMRVFRGGGLTKDAVYLRGFARVLEQLESGTQLREMLIGKIALESWPIVEELRWRGILEPACLLPGYLDEPEACRRLDRIVGGLTVTRIAEELA